MEEEPQGSLDIDRPGDRLRRARVAAGLDLATVATQTRVPVRHLEAIEANDFAALPGATYSVGFSRAFARAVGLDETQIAREVRADIADSGGAAPVRQEYYEPADPARVPPRWLAWGAVLIALLVAGGYGIWRTQMMTPPTDEQVAAPQPAQPATRTARPAAAPTTGPVVLTANAPVWLRIYDEGGTRLLEKEMAAGEAFTVPANAQNPMILTGRPQALNVTVGGRAVPPLGAPDRTISDAPISAAALLGRAVTPAAAPVAGAPPSAATPRRTPAPRSPSTGNPAGNTPRSSAPASSPTPDTVVPD